MTLDLKAIKARRALSLPGCDCCELVTTDLPACIAEIERLRWTVEHVLEYFEKEAFMECTSAEHCEIVLRKALEQE